MDTLSLMLSNNDIPNRSPRKQVEDRIGIGAFRLFVAASLRSLVALHATIEDGTGRDVVGFLEDNGLLRDRELGDWEREAGRRPLRDIGLAGIP